jgi:hypothetical protein
VFLLIRNTLTSDRMMIADGSSRHARSAQ